jgi:hypothetical protein
MNETTRYQIAIVGLGLVVIGMTVWYAHILKTQPQMSLEEAITIARRSECTQKGAIGRKGNYSASSSTWRIDFMPEDTSALNGCSPACVVFVASRSAAIDWGCKAATPAMKDDLIRLDSPLPGAEVSSPLTLTGEARGTWYFEASFPIKIYDANGKLLGSVAAEAQDDWMTKEYVPFAAELTFTAPTTKTGRLVLEKDNPSGLAKNANSLQIPIRFGPVAAMRAVKLYYYNPQLDQGEGGAACSARGLVAVTRTIAKTQTPLTDTIRLLLQGELRDTEREEGIESEFPLAGVALKSATITNGVARLTFYDPQNKLSGGSCRVSILQKEIERTAQQFSTVMSVKFLPDTLFQP